MITLEGSMICKPFSLVIYLFEEKTGFTTVQKVDVPGPDEKFCLCWLCVFTKFSSGGTIFSVHLIFERL